MLLLDILLSLLLLAYAAISIPLIFMGMVFAIPGNGKGTRGLNRIFYLMMSMLILDVLIVGAGLVFIWI